MKKRGQGRGNDLPWQPPMKKIDTKRGMKTGDRNPDVYAVALMDFLRSPRVGYRKLTGKALLLYTAALTHSSFLEKEISSPPANSSGEDYERLEFLGDRVLNLVVAEYLYEHTNGREGEMTGKMEFVKNRHLSFILSSPGIDFPRLIRVGPHQRLTPGIVAAAFEAFIGASFLDRGYEETRAMVMRLIGDELEIFSPEKNYKKILQELLQHQKQPLPLYQLQRKEGLDHAPFFSYRVLVGDRVIGEGTGRTKAQATQDAARDALLNLGVFSDEG
ncbi:MAG: putative dsRNA-binding protein [Methanolinea sp.]|nr:putative dsRNA-binding protein [Methanolinea sp.]